MSEEVLLERFRTAEYEAKIALLEQIKAQLPGMTTAASIQGLAYAYALTVGGSIGNLPGGPVNINVTKK